MSKESSPLIDNNENGGANTNDGDVHTKIATMRQLMQETHDACVNFHYDWRKQQLTQLKTMVNEHWDEILDALNQDLGKSPTEGAAAEMLSFGAEVEYFLANTHRLMQPKDVPSAVAAAPAFSKVTPLPRNGPAVLVIGPSNYPISISLMAVAGSLAAGNPTVLKPSELCPASASLLAKYVPQYFEAGAFQIVTGGVPETTALLEQEWGLIHFTGSERVGKIVAAAGAKTLTPCVLELGGKCPTYVDETCPSDIAQVANRIVWAKTLNCGQNCISPDYLLVHKSKIDALLPELTRTLETQYGQDPQQSELSRLVAPGHIQRAIALMQDVETLAKTNDKIQILCGGSKECDAKANYVAPTFVLNPPLDCRLMQEEIFSPILPIIVVESRDEAVDIINSRPGVPLGLYTYTSSDAVFQEMLQRCRSGTAVRNDAMVQFCGPHLPFGGLGTSGTGNYRGEYSFRAFSHMMPTVYRPLFPGADMNMVRYQPFAAWKSFLMRNVLPIAPDVPVLKSFKRAILVAIVAVGVVTLAPENAIIHSVRVGLASILQKAAQAISP